MKVILRIVVVDAADIEAESAFWAALLEGTVHRDDDWHSIVVDGEWIMGIQQAPNYVPPQWPTASGQQQQVHLDLHVGDIVAAGERAIALGGRQLQARRSSICTRCRR